MCYTCKAPCSSLQVTDIAGLCSHCENCGAFTLLSPVIPIKDYEYMKTLQSGGMRRRIVIKNPISITKKTARKKSPASRKKSAPQ